MIISTVCDNISALSEKDHKDVTALTIAIHNTDVEVTKYCMDVGSKGSHDYIQF